MLRPTAVASILALAASALAGSAAAAPSSSQRASQPASQPAASAPTDASANGAGECVRLAKLEEWGGAIKECKAAYLATADPRLLFTLAQVYRQSGDAANAVHYFKLVLTDPNEHLDDTTRAGIQKLLDEQEAILAQKSAQQSPATQTTSHPVGHPASRPTPAHPTTAIRPPSGPPPPPIPPPALPPPAPPFYDDVLGDALAAGAVLGLVSGGVLLALADGDLHSQPASLDDWHSTYSEFHTFRNIGIPTLIGGGLLAGAATVRWVLVSQPDGAQTTMAIGGPGLIGATIGGSF
jgi:hypothetical protein